MVFEHHPHVHAFFEAATQIIIGVVINQRAGINPHLPVFLEDHLAEIAHEMTAGLFSLVDGHAMFGDLGPFGPGPGSQEFRKAHDTDVGWDLDLMKEPVIKPVHFLNILFGRSLPGDRDTETLLV